MKRRQASNFFIHMYALSISDSSSLIKIEMCCPANVQLCMHFQVVTAIFDGKYFTEKESAEWWRQNGHRF